MILEQRKMVAFDLDDVLADFINPFMEICARLHNRPDLIGLPPSDWEWTNAKLTREQLDVAWNVVNNTYNFWENLPMESGVDPSLVRKVYDKCNVVFPTARVYAPGRSGIAGQSAEFLKKNYSICYPTVIVGSNKGPLAAALEYDYFIDDRPKNVIEVKQSRPECKVFLKNASHNAALDSTEYGVPRIAGSNEFCELILGEL